MIKKDIVAKQPEVIKVGPLLYSVYFTKEKAAEASLKHGSKIDGYCDKVNLEIIINPELNIQLQRETLWHEIKHCCFMWVAVALDTMDEEQIVTLTAPLELQVMRENKDLMEFLTVA